MTKTQERELAFLERRLAVLQMSSSERVAAVDALRNGFIIVEHVAWLGKKMTQIGAFLFSRPKLARRFS
jgi:hypothetical protein